MIVNMHGVRKNDTIYWMVEVREGRHVIAYWDKLTLKEANRVYDALHMV